MNPQPAVKVEDLSFRYGTELVLDQVNFEIARGDFVGIIGPNGGGKTTLLRILMGFLSPTHGSVKILGTAPKKAIASIGYVPQRLPFDSQFPISVMEVVLTGRLSLLPWYGCYRASDREAAANALARVDLSTHKNAPFGSLSGGQAQRALIARAIVSKPQILLLDEPTASVDVRAQMTIYEILKSLKSEMTILMVTHDLNAVIEQVQNILCVQGNAFPLSREEVCKHFAFGLYHTPLINIEPESTR